jgi:hypothetical protein
MSLATVLEFLIKGESTKIFGICIHTQHTSSCSFVGSIVITAHSLQCVVLWHNRNLIGQYTHNNIMEMRRLVVVVM